MLVALVLCVGCAAAADQVRGPQSPEEAIAQTLAGLSNVIRAGNLGPPPRSSDGSHPDGTWLHIEVAADNPMEAAWEAALLAGAVADRTAGDGHFLASVITGWIVDEAPSDGSIQPEEDATNYIVVAGERFLPPGDDNEIKRGVTATLARFGARPVSIEVLHPRDVALKVVATIPTPHAMNRRLAELQSVLIGMPTQYEGVYLEIRLPDGSPIAKLWTTYRTVIGAQSVRPDLEDILGGPPHGGLGPPADTRARSSVDGRGTASMG